MSEKENKGTLPEEKTEVVSDEKLKDVAGGILFSAENCAPWPRCCAWPYSAAR